MLPPPAFRISLFFSLTDGSVVSLPTWFLNSKHKSWKGGTLSLQLLEAFLGLMIPGWHGTVAVWALGTSPTGALLRATVLFWPMKREPGQRPGLLVPRVKSWLSVCCERRKLRPK